ncbi:MAG: hypothetical protein IT371_06175 [Deltaproteobacteria bacterium]|nr:hypothetical protein [Deltaproteobacteria bacterium]
MPVGAYLSLLAHALRSVDDTSTDARSLDERFPPGALLGRGAYKEVHAVLGNPNLALALCRKERPEGAGEGWSPAQHFARERTALRRLRAAGVATVEVVARGVASDGAPGVVYRRYAVGSKDPLERRLAFFNERSARDLARLTAALATARIRVVDPQVLIGDDGTLVLADPQELLPNPRRLPQTFYGVSELVEAYDDAQASIYRSVC